MELITFIIHQQHLALPDLVNLAADNLSHLILIFLIERIMLKLQDLRSQRLTQVQNSATAELLEVHLLTHFLAYLIVGLNLLGFAQRYLLVLILHLAVGYYYAVTVNLKVTLIRVDDHVKVLIRSINLGDDVAETLFQHAHQCSTVDVLGLFELLKGLNH